MRGKRARFLRDVVKKRGADPRSRNYRTNRGTLAELGGRNYYQRLKYEWRNQV